MNIALIDTLADKSDDVRKSVAQSICDTGKKLPTQTVLWCTNYLTKHQKLADTHRALILRVIERIINYHQQQQPNEVPFDHETLETMAKVGVNEMMMPKVR